jgi:hypothetical protein
VQVDPIKPTLEPPGTKGLKLTYDEPLSKFAFNFSLRRYTKVVFPPFDSGNIGKAVQVDLVKPTLKAPGDKRLKPEHKKLRSNFAFNCNLRHRISGCWIPPRAFSALLLQRATR